MSIDLDRAAQKGVTAEGALTTLQTMLGSEYVANFIRFGQMYKVMVQALPEYRATPEQLLKLQTKSSGGELVPLSAFMTIEKSYAVDQITRYNMYPSAELNGGGKSGISSSAVLRAVQETARDKLPRGFSIDWAGISRDEVNAGIAGNVGTEITPGRPVPNPVADFAIGLQSSWEMDAWGKLRNERQSAVARYLATAEGANLVLTGLIADVAAAYFELLALDHTLDFLAQTVVRQQEALEVVRLQKLAGRANELAVQQFEAHFDQHFYRATAVREWLRLRGSPRGVSRAGHRCYF